VDCFLSLVPFPYFALYEKSSVFFWQPGCRVPFPTPRKVLMWTGFSLPFFSAEPDFPFPPLLEGSREVAGTYSSFFPFLSWSTWYHELSFLFACSPRIPRFSVGRAAFLLTFSFLPPVQLPVSSGVKDVLFPTFLGNGEGLLCLGFSFRKCLVNFQLLSLPRREENYPSISHRFKAGGLRLEM